MVFLAEGKVIRDTAGSGHIAIIEKLPYPAEYAEQTNHRQSAHYRHMIAAIDGHIDRKEEQKERKDIGIRTHDPEQKVAERVSQFTAKSHYTDKDQHRCRQKAPAQNFGVHHRIGGIARRALCIAVCRRAIPRRLLTSGRSRSLRRGLLCGGRTACRPLRVVFLF